MIEGFGSGNIDYLHIGADEVFNFASCRECKLFVQQSNDKLLFARWVTKVVKWIRQRYPYLNIMAWDDMYRNWPSVELMLLRTPDPQQRGARKHEIQPCVWVYAGQKEAFDMTVSEAQLQTTCLEFKRVWVASAFQGANEPSASWTDFEQRLHNHRLWLERLQNSVYKQTYQEAIQGIIMTGWTRYTHQSVLCEMLPMTVPSLSLCLMVIEAKQFNMETIYSQLVQMLYLQPRKLLQPIESVYVQGSLREYVRESPWMKRSKRKAKAQFCNDAFEIAWIINKGLFLLGQIETTMRDWNCSNVQEQINFMLQRKAYSGIIQQELSRLLEDCRAIYLQQRNVVTQATRRHENNLPFGNHNLSVNQLRDSDSMELDDLMSIQEQNQQKAQNRNSSNSLEAAANFENLRLFTSSSEDNPSCGVNGQKAIFRNMFDFEDRVYGTLRTQFYKQIRGCIKLFRKAALLCEKVLPNYLNRADIDEFRNSKVLPHLLKAYQLLMMLTCQKQISVPQLDRKQSTNDIKDKFGLGNSPKHLLGSNLHSSVQGQNQTLTAPPNAIQSGLHPFSNTQPVTDSEVKEASKLRVVGQSGVFYAAQKPENFPKTASEDPNQNNQHQRQRICQTPDLRPLSGSPLLMAEKKELETTQDAIKQFQVGLNTRHEQKLDGLFLEEIPLRSTQTDFCANLRLNPKEKSEQLRRVQSTTHQETSQSMHQHALGRANPNNQMNHVDNHIQSTFLELEYKNGNNTNLRRTKSDQQNSLEEEKVEHCQYQHRQQPNDQRLSEAPKRDSPKERPNSRDQQTQTQPEFDGNVKHRQMESRRRGASSAAQTNFQIEKAWEQKRRMVDTNAGSHQTQQKMSNAFAKPLSKDELRKYRAYQHSAEESGGCEAHRKNKRQTKILKKRLNVHLKRDLEKSLEERDDATAEQLFAVESRTEGRRLYSVRNIQQVKARKTTINVAEQEYSLFSRSAGLKKGRIETYQNTQYDQQEQTQHSSAQRQGQQEGQNRGGNES